MKNKYIKKSSSPTSIFGDRVLLNYNGINGGKTYVLLSVSTFRLHRIIWLSTVENGVLDWMGLWYDPAGVVLCTRIQKNSANSSFLPSSNSTTKCICKVKYKM